MELDELVRAELERYLDESRVGPEHPESPLITTRNGQAFTGNGLYQVLKRLKVSSGVSHLCPHALRHYWTEHFDGDLLELMRAGGWNSLTMVDRYRGHPHLSERESAPSPAPSPQRRTRGQGEGPDDKEKPSGDVRGVRTSRDLAAFTGNSGDPVGNAGLEPATFSV